MQSYALCGNAKPPPSSATAGWSWTICRQALRPWSAPIGFTLMNLAVAGRQAMPPRALMSSRTVWPNLERSSAEACPAALLPIGPAKSRTATSSEMLLSVTPAAPLGVAGQGAPVAALRALASPPLVACPPAREAVPLAAAPVDPPVPPAAAPLPVAAPAAAPPPPLASPATSVAPVAPARRLVDRFPEVVGVRAHAARAMTNAKARLAASLSPLEARRHHSRNWRYG